MDDYYANSMRIVAEDAHAQLQLQALQVEDVASGEDQVGGSTGREESISVTRPAGTHGRQ